MNLPVNPLPLALLLLLPMLPGIWAGGFVLLRRMTLDVWLARVLAAGVSAAAWLSAVHVLGYATRSFVIGMSAGTLLVGLGGWAAAFWHRRRPLGPALAEPMYLAPSRWMWITAALTTLFLAPTVLRFYFFDEINVTGHLAIVAQLQNGAYPPRNLTFPAFELQYHFGVNLLAAMLTALTRVRIDLALDIITLAGWAYCWCLLWVLGDRLFGRHRGALTALCGLLGGGFPYFCEEHYLASSPLGTHFTGVCGYEGEMLNPTTAAYIFQHPWSLGLPLLLCLVCLLTQRAAPGRAFRLACVGALLFALSLAQFPSFLAVAPCLVVADAFPDGRFRPLRGLALAGVTLLVFAAASQLGGFFASRDGAGFGLEMATGIVGTVESSMRWHFRTFGLPLLLGVFGLWLMRERVFFVLLIVGSLVVVNFARYAFSWDILKFATLAALGLAIPSSAALAYLLRAGSPGYQRALAGVSLLVVPVSSVVFLAGFLLMPKGIPVFYPSEPPKLTRPDARACAWLRKRIRPGEIVYVREGKAFGYASWAGLPQIWVANAHQFPFKRERIEARYKLAATPTADPAVYAREGVRFFVLDKEDGTLNDFANAWIAKGLAQVKITPGPLRVIELQPAR